MLRLVIVVVLSALVISTEARGGRGGGSSSSGGRGRNRPSSSSGGQFTCQAAVQQCQIQAMEMYPDVARAASGGPRSAENALIEEITTDSLQQHCRCVMTSLESDACNGELDVIQYLPLIRDVKNILDYVCQPDSLRIISANIKCFTDEQTVDNFNTCPNEMQQELMEYLQNNGDSSCQAIVSKSTTLFSSCIGEKVSQSRYCSATRTNGGKQFMESLSRKVFDIVIKQMMPCPTGRQALAGLMTMHKRLMNEIYVNVFK